MGRIRVNATDPVFGGALGEVDVRVHDLSVCGGRDIPCCVHNPSDHHMVGWPMNWRADTGVMERICVHGVGHPDPDHMAYVCSLTPGHDCEDESECEYPHLEWQGIHGCCGCCSSNKEK
jgi:hypothetical protein